MPEHKPNILCTRSLNPLLAAKAGEQGIAIDMIPFIETREIINDDLERKITALASQSLTVVFTSIHAVEAISSRIEKRKGALGKKTGWKIFCLEGRTKKSVAEHFGEDHIAGTASSASKLAGLITGKKISTEIVFFCGNQKREELSALLADADIKVNEVTVYETILTAKPVNKVYDGIIFFSPSAVKSFFSLNQPGEKTILFAIGPTTAESIKTYSQNTVLVSEQPDEGIFIETVFRYFQTHRVLH